MLVEIPPKMSVSGFVGYLKGKSSQMIFERWANARFKYRNRSFWCRGFYVDSVGKNSKAIGEYIRNQLKEDPLVKDGLPEASLVDLALPRAKTAREVIETVAKVLDEKGSAEEILVFLLMFQMFQA